MCRVTKKSGIDKCLKPFIVILNKNKIKTQFSCCGHGSEDTHIIFPSGKDISKLFSFMGKYGGDFIKEIRSLGEDRWNVSFYSLVCTPPRLPCWVNTKVQRTFIHKVRFDLGFLKKQA